MTSQTNKSPNWEVASSRAHPRERTRGLNFWEVTGCVRWFRDSDDYEKKKGSRDCDDGGPAEQLGVSSGTELMSDYL